MSSVIEEWKIEDIAKSINGEIVSGSKDAVVRGITTDSRSIPPKSLFVAIKGEKFDAHDFVSKTAEEGAIAAIVDRSVLVPQEFTLIRVRNTVEALGELAKAYRDRFSPVLAGVTGSSGKTSVKNYLSAILKRRYRTVSTTGNLNNHIGVPLTLFELKRKTEKAVIEMGMSNPGEIARLTEIASPSVGVITSIAPCHLETLGSLDGVISAKSELIEYLNNVNGTIVLPSDSEHFQKLISRAKCRVISAGTSDNSNVRISNIHSKGYEPVSFVYRGVTIQLRLPGTHNALNAALAAAAAEAMGADTLDIVEGLQSVFPVDGRSSLHKIDGIKIIDDAYNSNPLSLSTAIKMLAEEDGRKILVMSDMLELGPDETVEHIKIGRLLDEKKIDLLIYKGSRTEHTANASSFAHKIKCSSNEEIYSALNEEMKKGDVVLFKASHGMKLYEVVKDVIERKEMSMRRNVVSLRK